jgi:hypothetical protein
MEIKKTKLNKAPLLYIGDIVDGTGHNTFLINTTILFILPYLPYS